jgi:hypothetical integral membrane protein (TIGR02206 family)
MSWLATPFQPFGMTHGVIAVLAAGVCFACGAAARADRNRSRRSFADGFAGVVLGWNLLANLWWLLPSNFVLDTSLPLHVCDLVNLVIPFAIWSRNRFLLALSVLWGLGLSTQAFFTPTVNEAPDDLRYWLFWGGHLTAAAGCCVIAGGIDFRPGWKDWARVVLAGVGVVLGLMWFNHLTGSNYGYVGNDMPSRPTLIDRLGPWPARVVWLILIGAAAQALVVVLYPVLALVIEMMARRVGRR